MGKIHWTEEKIEKLIKQGKGMGEGELYKPWLDVKDVPSSGLSSRIRGWKTGRIHHFLSKLEKDVFYAFEWSEEVVDIREQFPLDRSITAIMAEEKSIKHPTYPGTNVLVVMTTDLVLTLRTEEGISYIAVAIKPSDHLEDMRVIEKLEVERSYWRNKGIRWIVITEKQINKAFSTNMDWIHSHYHHKTDFDETALKHYILSLKRFILTNKYDTVLNILNQFVDDRNLDDGTALTLFKHCVARKVVEVDMFNQIRLDQKIFEGISINDIC